LTEILARFTEQTQHTHEPHTAPHTNILSFVAQHETKNPEMAREKNGNNDLSSLRETILSIYKSLPLMEQHWSEVCEMRVRLEQKEQEMSKTISDSKNMLKMLAHEILGDTFVTSGDAKTRSGKGTNPKDPKRKRKRAREDDDDDDLSSIALMLLADSKIANVNTPPQTPFSTTGTTIAETLPVPMVADLTMKESKDSLMRRRSYVEDALEKTKADQDRVCQEIAECERNVKLLEGAMEERRQLISDCEVDKGLLDERRSNLRKEFEDLGSKYCEMNEALLGQSFEESRAFLESIRVAGDPSSAVNTRSPLLQKYLGVWNEMKQTEEEMEKLLTRVTELGAEDDVARRQVLELNGDLCVTEEELMREAKDCECEIHRLDMSVRDDLMAALRWGVRESGGLYQPSVSTAPLVLLLFQQYCRQQVGSRALSREKLDEGVTLDRLRRYGCCVWGEGLKRAGYTASEVRSAGFSLKELQLSSTADVKELHAAGCSLQEFKDAGTPVVFLRGAGFLFLELIRAGYSLAESFPYSKKQLMQQLGYSLQELKDGGVPVGLLYSVKQMKELGFSLQEMKDGGVSPGDLKYLGYSLAQLKQVGYSCGDLWQICLSREEIGSIFSPMELQQGGLTVSQFRSRGFPLSELKQLGFLAGDLRCGGYSLQEIFADYSLQEMRESRFSASSLKSMGATASQLKGAGFTNRELLSGGFSLEEINRLAV
jgi:hypothetical protein